MRDKAFYMAFLGVLLFVLFFVLEVEGVHRGKAHYQGQPEKRLPANQKDHCYQKAHEKLSTPQEMGKEEGHLLFAVLCLES